MIPLAEAARRLGVLPDRLLSWCDGDWAPHYRIDGGPPVFKIQELRAWFEKNVVTRHGGRDLPEPVRLIWEAPACKMEDRPLVLKRVRDLADITQQSVPMSGCYFLCLSGEVVYVGQSRSVLARLSEHHKAPPHKFDRVYYIPWPSDDLSRLEAALIRMLRPPGNGVSATGKMRTSYPDIDDGVVLDMVMDASI